MVMRIIEELEGTCEKQSDASPFPDTGQWLLLALNEKLPQTMFEILRAHIIGLHHFLMLFIMLAFSVLSNSVKAHGLELGARYMFTMGIERLFRAISFISTVLPSPRPWCVVSRYRIPVYPHRWAEKYYVPYTDANSIRQVITSDMAYCMCCLLNLFSLFFILLLDVGVCKFILSVFLSIFHLIVFHHIEYECMQLFHRRGRPSVALTEKEEEEKCA